MSITERDRKVLLVVVPLVALLGYWFLVLAPKRDEASQAGAELTKQEEARDAARSQLSELERAKTSFAADYSQLVQLGKAIPSSVDMPSLIVQLDRAARGTGIKFNKISTGERQAAAAPAASAAAGSGAGGSGSSGGQPASGTAPGGGGTTPASGGGAPAQSAPGQASASAANTVGAANAQNGANAQSSGSGDTVTPQDAQTSQQARDGKLPVGGATGGQSGAATTPGACAPGLECIPLQFEFDGRFFDLADFFHRLKRFVAVANDKVLVRGRLLTIDGLKFSSGELFPRLKAEIKATVYLAPKAQGVTAGATPQGPPATTPVRGSGEPASAPSSTPPTAGATP